MMPIAITGMAVWDTLGHDIDQNWQQLLADRDPQPKDPMLESYLGFALAPAPADIEQFRQANFSGIPSPWFNQVAAWVTSQAVAQAGLVPVKHRRAGFASSLFGDAESQMHTATSWLGGRKRTGPGDLFYTVNDTLISTVSRIHQIGGITASLSASCSAGLYSIEIAAALIAQGSVDQAILLSQDLCVKDYNAYRMKGLGAFSRINRCRPFDQARDGIVFGDASAALVIESAASVEQRGVEPLAWIVGLGSTTQHLHRTSPQEASGCYYEAFDKMLASSGLDASAIDWISAHATGTRDGDQVENDVMSDLLPDRPVTSFKSHLGHTMGACGLAETVYTIQAMNQCVIPRVGNLDAIDLPTKIRPVRDHMTNPGNLVIKNSYGFGGRAASMLLQKHSKYSELQK